MLKNIASKLSPTTVLSESPITADAVSMVNEPKLASLNSITLKIANTSNKTVKALIGDGKGIVASVHGLGTVYDVSAVTALPENPSGGNYAVFPTSGTVDPKIFAASLSHPIVVKEIIAKASNSSAALDEDIELLLADIGGDKNNGYIRMSEYTTENQYNEKVKRIKLANGITLSDFRAATMNVVAGEEVSLTFIVAAAGDRN